jgi:pimeloyl-ACP methyl ester carboxylesterase
MNSKRVPRRGFVDISAGQAHFRMLDAALSADKPPLVMFHASPGSSKMLVPLMAGLATRRNVYAIDTLGNGDSAPPPQPEPPLEIFVDAHIEAIEALGLDTVDLYGSHTGGCIACEIAIRRPGAVRRLVLDGMSLYSDAERDDMLRHYAPALTPSLDGTHLIWIWHFVRDAYLFWPWYKRDAAQVRDVGLPSADSLHDKFVEVAKAARTYHLSYRAAIAYDKAKRLPLLTTPTLLSCAETDMLIGYFESVAALLPKARRAITPGFRTREAAERSMAMMIEFLDAPVPGMSV